MTLSRLISVLGIRTPVIAPPMAGASGGLLAARVMRGGGFGFMAVGYDTLEKVHRELNLARSILDLPLHAPLPIGVGFLGWQLDKAESQGMQLIDAVLENRVQAIWLSFGNNLARWAQYVRQRDTKTLLFVQVSSQEEAKVAVHDLNADVVVAQGHESGGHGHSQALPVRQLTRQVLSVVGEKTPSPCVLAAGGLVDGNHVAEMLDLGASGAVLGTRFLLSPESLYTDAQRAALIDAKGSPTVRTMAFDEARGTLGWPAGVDGRGLKNDTVADFDAGEDIGVIKTKFDHGVKQGDPKRMLVWAGEGVAHMTQIQPAEDIVAEIHQVFQHHSYQAEQSPSANQSTGNNNSSGKEQQARTSSTKLRGLPKDSVDVRVSKTLSWLLRHGAQSEGLAMRSDGFVRVADILSNPKLKAQSLDLEGLQEIVKADNKQRYTLLEELGESAEAEKVWLIRANQGHSMKGVRMELTPITSIEDIPTGVAVHGTTWGAWKSISKQGLSKMTRNHIHIAQGIAEDNVVSGMRKSSQILIFIDVKTALEDGIAFFLSDNGVILTEGDQDGFLKPKYFSKVEDTKGVFLSAQ